MKRGTDRAPARKFDFRQRDPRAGSARPGHAAREDSTGRRRQGKPRPPLFGRTTRARMTVGPGGLFRDAGTLVPGTVSAGL